MARYNQIFIVLGVCVVILLMVRGPVYFQTHTETDTHENDAVLQKRPESYQNKVKNVILPKENQKKLNHFEESNNKLPTPIRPTEPLEVIRRDCGELCNTSRDGSPVFTNGNVKPTLNLPMYLKPPSPYKYINITNVAYSQAKQDQTVYHLFPKKNGFFIEMGAFDRMRLSNTLWLERHHNWTGLLIEANPDLCDAIDKRKRRVWRLCACISTESSTTFIKGGALGSAKDTVDKDHLKQLNPALTVTVLCFKLDTVLDQIQQSHIDYFSLDVEGAELFVLNSMKNELKSGKIIVDVWTIEYRVWDGTKIIVDKSKNNLERLRNFFKDVDDYVEHSQLSNNDDTSDGMALDVVFVYIKSWCQKHQTLPSGAKC